MSEEKDANIYVWQKSERIGKIVVEQETKDGWLYFTDGSRINPKLVDEFLSRATSMEEAEGISKILSPTSNVLQAGTETTVNSNNAKSINVDKKEINHTFNPDDLMVDILEKLSKKNKTKFNVNVNISMPSKMIFKALQADVEEEELKRGLVLLVKKQINNIEEQLNKEVETFIQNQYYESTTTKKSV